ncbi:MAG: hypothetical protein JO033_28235 [Acidobacteriaceae bacterium]|nr:hypothetical protein [Acidobacteriaceae bacterium]MBV9499146.1 hypothetical protein [Acidobacteriaceae bacterium]
MLTASHWRWSLVLGTRIRSGTEKTAQTEVLIEALENSGRSSARVNVALTGFASQYGAHGGGQKQTRHSGQGIEPWESEGTRDRC